MERPLAWVGASKKDYAAFPAAVQDDMGYRLYRVQAAEPVFPPAKPLNRGVLKGLGVYELAEDHDGDTYRAVYTLNLGSVVYVLHAFKKKATSGSATPARHIDVIRSRYYDAVAVHRQRFHGG